MSQGEYHPPVVVDGVDPDGERVRRARRVLYLTVTAILTLLMALAVTDAAGVTTAYGVNSSRAKASGGGIELEVYYGKVSRPALATPFEISVRKPGGFSEPITVSLLADYFSMWDENGLDPSPTAETTDGDRMVWTFDPPPGDELTISYDARIEPAAQSGKKGAVAVLDGAGAELVSVSFKTAIRP